VKSRRNWDGGSRTVLRKTPRTISIGPGLGLRLSHVVERGSNPSQVVGRRDEAYRVVEEAKSLSARRYVSPLHIATVYAGLDDVEAFEWLEKGFEDRSWLMTWLEVDALFDPIRSDERFRELSRRVWR
jgi:hypothetical protein